MALTVSSMLTHKGADVMTITADQSLAEAATLLCENNIGALVVSSDGHRVEGILSERDIVRRLHARGTDCLHESVADAMTTEVTVCRRDDTSDQLMAQMTASRIRHLPVVDDHDELAGIVSIGDVVRSRLDELETLSQSLREYITGSSY